jgi:hypothetical protein
MKLLAAVVAIMLPASAACAAGVGMFLCRSPVVANDFWNGLVTAQQTGVQVNRDIAASIARKNGCEFIASEHLKPIDYVAGQLAITDGKIKGWASPQLYILYVNRPGQ